MKKKHGISLLSGSAVIDLPRRISGARRMEPRGDHISPVYAHQRNLGHYELLDAWVAIRIKGVGCESKGSTAQDS